VFSYELRSRNCRCHQDGAEFIVANLSPTATVLRFRELVRSPAVLSTLERRSDKLLAFALRLEGIVSKRKDSAYRSGRSPNWLKMKNSDAPAVKREAEEDWGRERWR
jgi:hypothetical protein